MKFQIEPKDLLDAVRFAKKAVPGRALIDVLTHVKLSAANGSLTAEGSDLEVYARKRVTAAVTDEGGCCVSAKTLEQIAASCRGLVSCELVNDRLRIKSGLLEADLPTMEAAAFPAVDLRIKGEIEVDADLKPLAVFCSEDVTRPFLSGVNFVGGKVCASTGNVSAWRTGVDGLIANIHARHVPMLFGRLFVSERRWRCEDDGEATSGLLVESTLTEEQVDRVFRSGGEYQFSADADSWLSALGAVSIDDKASGVLHAVKDGQMTLTTQASTGTASDRISVAGDVSLTVGFQVRLLRLILTSAAGTVLSVSIDDGIYRMTAGEMHWAIVPYRMDDAT